MEFHLSRPARERYEFDRDLLKSEGELKPPDPIAVHELVGRMNQRLGQQGRGVKPGHLFALVLIQQILHKVVQLYQKRVMPDVFDKAEDWLTQQLTDERVQGTMRRFGEHYTPLKVFKGERQLGMFMREPYEDRPGRHMLLEQMLLVFLANINPAAMTTRGLYDDRELTARDDYLKHIWTLESFFAAQPTFGPGGVSLFELLAAPAKESPESLLGQLEYIRKHWAEILGEDFIRALLLAEDLVREDDRMPWKPSQGQGPDLEYLKLLASRAMFANATAEPERFSPDTDWMPRAVVLAKSVYVWLDQLSKKYNRSIRKLDEIPDEELDLLAKWGFTGLWLIGLWERSAASRTIKHLRGNIDAVASAYSIYDYRISGDLGGDAGLEKLKERAQKRGIRLASDLVPNHMGLDSRWVREHPDWFIQLDHPPYNVYQYNGPDLSGDPGIDLRIEDGYWHQTDAAVVFRRVDKHSGHTRYIYHGNDGTSMPWNDTAQLNFLIPEVREAMIQLILHVARQCSIIRFDAAMTLTKKHYQRLWFPEPGTGGAIPSRALFGLTREQLDQAMPVEFWREVVDRVAAEVPDTLLIAEAFWLLEGFFVRTLGMHRVYNSAFMNMLKLEENAKYRTVIKNILEFDPRVIQRFVNFMNNPDEDTAVAQFGKGDKYFGVCLMMATMPGLPMFGHGQIEGLTEKYGHEYQRAYYDERPDDDLVRRHEREIFPIIRQRHLFSGAEHFLLYDVYRDSGEVDENVFAYSNGYGDARSLVVFHNRYAETAGWIQTSAAFSVADGDARKLIRKTLGEGLGLRGDANLFYVLKDRITGLEYLRRGADLLAHGLFVQLRAYQYQVFTEFREVWDDAEGRWSKLAEMLGGRGVPSLDREYKRVYLAPLINAFERFATADTFRALLFTEEQEPESATAAGAIVKEPEEVKPPASPVYDFIEKARPFLEQARRYGGGTRSVDDALADLETMAEAVLRLAHPEELLPPEGKNNHRDLRDTLIRVIPERRETDARFWRVMCGFLCVWGATRLHAENETSVPAAKRMDDWLLAEALERTFIQLGANDAEANREVETVRAAVTHGNVARTFDAPRRFAGMIAVLDDPCVHYLIGCHSYGGAVWYHRESLDELLRLLFVLTLLDVHTNVKLTAALQEKRIADAFTAIRQIFDLSAISEYQIERFRLLLGYAGQKKKAESGKQKEENKHSH
ncbi:alpha-amylase [candidate division KSB1 bacterium]|nr:MAG: alpha-amylase [candidate division KSB1 bacterium]